MKVGDLVRIRHDTAHWLGHGIVFAIRCSGRQAKIRWFDDWDEDEVEVELESEGEEEVPCADADVAAVPVATVRSASAAAPGVVPAAAPSVAGCKRTPGCLREAKHRGHCKVARAERM